MKVLWQQTGRRLEFEFIPGLDDLVGEQETGSGNIFKLDKTSCYFEMPEDWSIENVHPDLLALATIFIIDPFTKDEIILPAGVTKHFSEEYQRIRKKRVLPVNEKLSARVHNKNPISGLCYSGGVDSTAAAILLPKGSVLVFTNRDMDGEGKINGLYDKSAALYACQEIGKLGYKVHPILTDFEFLRSPSGFPTHLSSAVPAILLADFENLESLGFGMILESAFGIGDNKFARPGGPWLKLLGAAGLPGNLVTGGLSEVATTSIVLKNPRFNKLAQSCVRGKAQQPCLNCVKCFRKILLERAISGEDMDVIEAARFMRLREVYKHITAAPIHHEDVYLYIMSKYRGNQKLLQLLKSKVTANHQSSNWLEKWYPGAADYLSPTNKEQLMGRIKKATREMSKSDIESLMNWDPKKHPENLEYQKANREFIRTIGYRSDHTSSFQVRATRFLRRLFSRIRTKT